MVLPICACQTSLSLWVVGGCSRLIDSWQRRGQIFKQLFDIYPYFRACLSERSAKFRSKLLALFCRDLALLSKINLVPNDYYSDLVASYLSRLFDPAFDIFKALPTRDVVAHHCHL